MQAAGKVLAAFLKSFGAKMHGYGDALSRGELEKNIAAWRRDRGDLTHRLTYALTEDSVVFDVGGYLGQWASDIFAMYQPWIHIFEPVTAHVEQIRQRFRLNKKIYVRDYGLYDRTTTMPIAVSKDATSLFRDGNKDEVIRVVRATDYIRDNGLDCIDLMKINIEGAEYELLEHLIDVGVIGRIQNIQVQFHDFMPDAVARMASIQARLAKTHHLTYQYPFVWENWGIHHE